MGAAYFTRLRNKKYVKVKDRPENNKFPLLPEEEKPPPGFVTAEDFAVKRRRSVRKGRVGLAVRRMLRRLDEERQEEAG